MIARMEKNLSNDTLTKLTDMKFEFEDMRIMNQSTRPSQILLGLHRWEIGSIIPQEVSMSALDKPLVVTV